MCHVEIGTLAESQDGGRRRDVMQQGSPPELRVCVHS